MKKTIALLVLPLIVLAVWVGVLAHGRMSGQMVALSITGYDPRDLLAGQYLSIRIDYGQEIECAENKRRYSRPAYLCLDTLQVTEERTPSDCSVFIRGTCSGKRFYDNVRRFYVSEQSAPVLEKALRRSELKPQILLSIDADGTPYPVDLILDGMPWREWTAKCSTIKGGRPALF
ncbi:MAG: GDYXXLXY domain-containing protein [Alphaproteobacteria bacterium]|jgi:uncharacterized membrane-anchored protein